MRNSYILKGSKKKLILLSKKVIANTIDTKKIIKKIKWTNIEIFFLARFQINTESIEKIK